MTDQTSKSSAAAETCSVTGHVCVARSIITAKKIFQIDKRCAVVTETSFLASLYREYDIYSTVCCTLNCMWNLQWRMSGCMSVCSRKNWSSWVSSFLTTHQHILGYLVPYHGTVDLDKKGRYNQGYFAAIKMNNKSIVKSKRENNVNKNMNMKDKSVRLWSRLFSCKAKTKKYWS